jgi:hypothetical protein
MNRDEILKWVGCLRALHRQHNTPTEIRVLKKNPDPEKSKRFPFTGTVRHFDTAQGAVDFIENFDIDETTNFYALLNPITINGKASNDADAIDYCWLPIDIDPVRRSIDEKGEFQALLDQKVPSSDEELESAKKASLYIQGAIKSVFPNLTHCVGGESGNGVHLLYRVNSGGMSPKEVGALTHTILEKFHHIFRNDKKLKPLWVNVDRSVANPARIWKIYGTLSQKGTASEDRPYRMAKLTKMGDPLTHTSLTPDDLIKLASELDEYIATHCPFKPQNLGEKLPEFPVDITRTPKKETPWIKDFLGCDLTTTDFQGACREAGILISEDIRIIERADGSSSRCIPVRCPNASNHSMEGGHWESTIMLPTCGEQWANFHCLHDGCSHLKGSETAYRLIGPDLVRKYSEITDVVEDLGKSSEFEPARERKETTSQGEEVDNPVKPWIESSWLRPLPSIMVAPPKEEEREQLVTGLIKRGEVTTLQAPTKIGKTFSLMHMALAWSHGKDWCGFEATRPLNVLFVDPELLFDEGEKRFRWVAMNVLDPGDHTSAGVQYVNLRGKPIMCHEDPWWALVLGLRSILEQKQFDLIIVDSIYQFQGERDPNASAEVVRMMNRMRAVTEEFGQPAVLYVHHFAKGNPQAKTSLDRAAGSYAFNAAADNIIVASPHKEANHYILEFHLRHQKSPEPVVAKLRDDIRLLDIVEGADPAAVDTGWQQDVTLGEGLLRVLLTLQEESSDDKPVKNSRLKFAAKKRLGISDTRVSACMAVMEEEGNVKRHGQASGLSWSLTGKGREVARYSSSDQAASTTLKEAAKDN